MEGHSFISFHNSIDRKEESQGEKKENLMFVIFPIRKDTRSKLSSINRSLHPVPPSLHL